MKVKIRGFTLIELMVTVAILSIIAAIAIPSYQSTILKAKRAEAKAALLDNVLQLERCYTVSSTYIDCSTVKQGLTEKGYYNLGYAVDATKTAYTLNAVAQGGQADDTHCAEFEVNEKGVKTATSTDCW